MFTYKWWYNRNKILTFLLDFSMFIWTVTIVLIKWKLTSLVGRVIFHALFLYNIILVFPRKRCGGRVSERHWYMAGYPKRTYSRIVDEYTQKSRSKIFYYVEPPSFIINLHPGYHILWRWNCYSFNLEIYM